MKIFLKRVGLIILILVLLEVAIRILVHPDITPVVGELDRVLGYKLYPNIMGVHRTKEFNTVIKINSKGLRLDETSYQKYKNEKRIVFLGDSFTYGWGVNKDERFTELIKNKSNFTVINAGVPGYKLSNMLSFFEKEGYKYDPDILIIMYNPSTGSVNINTGQYEVTNGTLIKTNLAIKTKKNQLKAIVNSVPGYSFLVQHSQLSALIRNTVINRLNKEAIKEQKQNCSYLKTRWDTKVKPIELLILQEFKSLANEKNIPLIIMVMPSRSCNLEVIKKINSSLSNILISDLNPHFVNNPEKYYYKYDGHWNKAGHQLAADILIDYLNKL